MGRQYQGMDRPGVCQVPEGSGEQKGARRQGRQKKRWKNHIREWTGLEFAKFQRAVDNRKK